MKYPEYSDSPALTMICACLRPLGWKYTWKSQSRVPRTIEVVVVERPMPSRRHPVCHDTDGGILCAMTLMLVPLLLLSLLQCGERSVGQWAFPRSGADHEQGSHLPTTVLPSFSSPMLVDASPGFDFTKLTTMSPGAVDKIVRLSRFEGSRHPFSDA